MIKICIHINDFLCFKSTILYAKILPNISMTSSGIMKINLSTKKTPVSQLALKTIYYIEINKITEESRCINCNCCGYDTCEYMARSIYHQINRKENCIHCIKDLAKKKKNNIQLAIKKTYRSTQYFLVAEEIRNLSTSTQEMINKNNEQANSAIPQINTSIETPKG